MRVMKDKNIRPVFENHYAWCLKEGRDTKWYVEYKKGDYDIRVETPKILQKNKKRKSLDKPIK